MSKHSALAPPRFVDRLDDCFFYHAMDLPGFGLVPGHWDLRGRFDDYVSGVDLAEKSVLDVGTATGFLSFEAEKKGASRVLSFDQNGAEQAFLPFKDKLHFRDPKRWLGEYGAEMEQWKNAYWLCRRLLDSKTDVFYGDIYHLPESLGKFQVAIVGSVLEHLSDQVSALASIARLVTETIIVVTPLLQTDERIARFEGRAENPDADFTWWTYSPGIYREVFGMLGFSIARITRAKFYHMYEDRFEERATIVAVRA